MAMRVLCLNMLKSQLNAYLSRSKHERQAHTGNSGGGRGKVHFKVNFMRLQ